MTDLSSNQFLVIPDEDLVFSNGELVSNYPTSPIAAAKDITTYLNDMYKDGYVFIAVIPRYVYGELKQFYCFKKLAKQIK
jgi:hypothetical protein